MLSALYSSSDILLIRADATATTGAGHAMRCLSLADWWIRGGEGAAFLWGDVCIPFVGARARKIGATICSTPPKGGARVLLVDTYDEHVRNLAAQNTAAVRVLVDDLGGPIAASYDAVWNPNAYGGAFLYPGYEGRVLSGPERVPVRSQLPQWTGGTPNHVGVVLGGGSVGPVVREAFQWLSAARPELTFHSVGSWAPAPWRRLDPDEVWHGLAGCERIILAGGITTWEAASVGIPVVGLQTASNQARVVEWMWQSGVPTVDVNSHLDAIQVAREIEAALCNAVPLRRIGSGVARVGLDLQHLSAERLVKPSHT